MLVDVCEIFADGDWIETKDQSPNGIRLVQTGNVGQGVFKYRGEKARYISEATFKRLRCTEIFEGDCLISRLPEPVGRTCLLPDTGERMITAVDCTIVRFNQNMVIPKFFNFYSQSLAYVNAVNAKTTGTTRTRISRSKLGQILIPLPHLRDQERIVAILDEAFEGIAAAVANTKKNLINARELSNNYRDSMFSKKGAGWKEKDFSNICDIASKLVDPRQPAFINLPHLGGGNMITGSGEIVDIKTARQEGLKSGKFLFDERMVLYSKIRPYLMKACRPDFSGLCSADVYPLSPNRAQLDRNFLFHILMNRHFTDYAIAGSDRVGMPKVNRDHLFRYKVWLPSIDEQVRLASKLDAISVEAGSLGTIYQHKLASLAALKQSILHKAFTGELTAQPEQVPELVSP